MNKLLTILSINLLLIPNICFGFDSNCFFKAVEDIPTNFIYLSKNCQAKIIAYVNKDGPVKEPIKGDCNGEPYECRVGDTLSKCMPCAASSAYLGKFLDFKDKYTELCQANKENILETACNEIFSVSTKKSTPTKQAYSPESISAPVFNSTNSTSDFSNTPSMMSTDQEIQQQYKEQIEEPTNQAIDLCKKSGGDWEKNTCNCEKYGMEYNKQKLRCEHTNIQSLEKRSAPQLKSDYVAPQKREVSKIKTNDATTLISVSVVDHYDSSKKIKDIEICYENIESCKTTTKTGTITFTHNHLATEKISPKISVKNSSGYHCDKPINTSDSMNLGLDNLIMGSEGYQQKQKNKIPADNTSFSFVVKCKKLCTDKDLKNTPNATKCYVKPDNQYEVSSCKNGYTPTTNKSACIEDNDDFVEEDIDTSFSSCDISGGTWNPKRNQCICDKDKKLKQSKDKKTCECKNSNETYNKKIDKCEKITTKKSDEQKINENFSATDKTPNQSDLCEYSNGSWNDKKKKCECDKNKGLKENKQKNICECREAGYIYSKQEQNCIKPKITMDEYKQIESGINDTVADTVSKIKTQCPDNKNDAPCDKKADLIQKIEQLAKDTLKTLKDLGKKQYN